MGELSLDVDYPSNLLMENIFTYVFLCVLYLVPELNTLVSVVWEVLSRNKSTGTLLNLQLAFLINHPTLTQHQSWTPAALQTLKDVVF